jgi:hypothetical protein
MPLPYLGLGYIAAAILACTGAFPAAALAGLALDLARITPVPMTAVLCLAWLVRLIPGGRKKWMLLVPSAVYIIVMGLCGAWDLYPLPGLVLGGLVSGLFSAQADISHRRGETGVAQVRLELAASVLSQTRGLLQSVPEQPIDEVALIQRAAERACGSCPCRKNCKDRSSAPSIPAAELRRSMLSDRNLPFSCRKTGRMVAELQRAQEQLRSLKAARERLGEYRGAVVQQYQFMGNFLQELSDRLSRRGKEPKLHFTVKVEVFSNRMLEDNGDRCAWFAGTEGRYYVLLCDGMGTGLGAISEGCEAARMLKAMLSAGFPAEHALRSVNSLCALRGQAGAVTVDLAEIALDSGRVTVYKWGAAPSYLITALGAEKIGTAGPPPGLSVTQNRETVDRLSLSRGELLVLTSDGAGGEEVLRGVSTADLPGQIGRRLVMSTGEEQTDDATAVVIRLMSA